MAKKTGFWLAILYAAAFSLVVYQEMAANVWPPESLRLALFSILLFVFLSAAFWGLLEYFSWSFGAALILLTLTIWAPVAMHPEDFKSEKSVYFLLPVHTLQIIAVQGDESIALSGFQTEAGGIRSFDELKTVGWERKGDQMVLVDPSDNLITWHGKTGNKATLTFKSGRAPAEISVSWDGAVSTYNLFSTATAHNQIKDRFSLPIYASWPVPLLALHLAIAFLSLIHFVEITPLPGLSAPGRRWLVHALPFYLTWSVYLLVFWPGFVPFDAIEQWTQIATGQLVNWHPVAHTLTIWLITRVWYSPAAVALVQIAALGSVLGWSIATLREFGAPARLAWLTNIVLAILPVTAVFSLNLYKDVLFSTAIVAFTTLILKIVATRGTWLGQKWTWLWLALPLIFASLYRQNGVLVAAFGLLVLTLAFRKHWRTFLKTACLFLAVYSLFTPPVLRLFGVPSTDRGRFQLIMANLLATHMAAGTYFSPHDRDMLIPAFPEYPWPADCNRNDNFILKRHPDGTYVLDRDYLVEHSRKIADLAVSATLQNPQVTLQHFLCQGAFVLQVREVNPNVDVGRFTVSENELGFQSSSLLPMLYAPGYLSLEWLSHNQDVNWLVWRMPFWMYLVSFGCVLFCIRNRTWLPLLILLPGLLTVLPLIILSLGQIFRYVYSMYLIGILFSAYFWLCTWTGGTEKGSR